jgi:predicted SprT family Zn-dependent metalloprotease
VNRTTQITQDEYGAFQAAYDFFNAELFNGTLPAVLITLQRHSKAYGFLAPKKFIGRSEETATHELALNPDHFGRTDEAILATLVHEMAHAWQVTHGTPPRKSYHDREWAQKMMEIGLHPSSTGEPGGKQTGAKVSHYIIEGGPFAQAFARLKARGFEMRWQSRADQGERKKKAESKTKYTCPSCQQNAWAKPGAALICGVCYNEDGAIHVMEAEPSKEN